MIWWGLFKASCTFQCGKKHLWSLLSIFACFYGECSQILGQVLMKMWKWDYVRRKNDSPASKDSLQKRVYFSTALWQKLCFSTQWLKITKKSHFDVLKKSPKLTIFGNFDELFSTQNVNVARFARNFECDFLCDFQPLCTRRTWER